MKADVDWLVLAQYLAFISLKPYPILLCAREALNQAGNPDVRDALYSRATSPNPWFTFDEIERARIGWINALKEESLNRWIGDVCAAQNPRRVGLVLAGNIPWVGLHDVLATLVTGHKALVKLSSDDLVLMAYVLDALKASGLLREGQLEVVERLTAPEAVVATGSNNSSRYFLHYFSHIPHLIRKSRTSVAYIGKNSSEDDIHRLADDLFSYYGLGCRNVRHLMLEEGLPVEPLLEIWRERACNCMMHARYANNFDYQLALHMMNRVPHHFVPGLILRRDDALFCALSVVTWQYYADRSSAVAKLASMRDQWQCTVGPIDLMDGVVSYGKSQSPELWDYADGVSTLKFLQSVGTTG
ncbi:MAG: acyl-CoA reductase [Sphingomonadales bacterium]|nr:acyl-CoA reductase [Sphingomonadales bacterium]